MINQNLTMKTKNIGIVLFLSSAIMFAQESTRVKVSIDEASVGNVTFSPKTKKDGTLKKGTTITLKALPKAGKSIDATYFSYPGRWGTMYSESMEDSYTFKAEQDIQLGASYIDQSEIDHLDVIQNISYAQPGKKVLKYDVFSPKGAKNLPMIIIIHGGGWSANTEDVMRGLARELTKSKKFVVCSMDYRWIGNFDGDEKENSMHELIEDVYGGIVHIKEHAAQYGGDGSKLFVTGDSAGGHLSASASLMIEAIGDGGFGKTPGVYELKPTYLPEGKSTTEVRTELLASIKGAAPSYGVFSAERLNIYVKQGGEDYIEKVAPMNYIPSVENRSIPQFLVRGTRDGLITDQEVAAFTKALDEAGQRAEYIQISNAGHAFFDWKPDQRTKDTFKKFGVYYAHRMEEFFLSVLND